MFDLKQKFRDRQYKLTSQRQTILQAFLDNPGRHLSAEDVYTIVRRQSPEIGLATVYRTLELFSELEVVRRLEFGDGRQRYELTEASNPHHHHHLICLQCGKVKEFGDDLLETLETAVAKRCDFTVVDHQLKFYGYCQECQKRREN
jgi:Fe2+/Zn2+ uptake regulation proteins